MSGLDLMKCREIISVVRVEKGSAADEAGMLRGDVLLILNGRPASLEGSLERFREILKSGPGREVQIRFNRGGEERSVTIALKRMT
jgi:S1-C subfamily serine protease